MSVMEPNPEDELFQSLEAAMAEEPIDESGILVVTTIKDHELGPMVQECDRRLEALGELHSPAPKTEEARELHSRRGALLIEMTKRGLR